jgi:pimeloyl-ACP methyl ester carboxylesterase
MTGPDRAAVQAQLASAEWDPEEFTPADHAAVVGDWSWLGTVAAKAGEGGPDGQVDDELAYVAPWGFDPGQVRAPALFRHGGRDRVAPVSHGRRLARPHPAAALGWLREHT